MKNKKLFAILTLVCFMFTLMPVAAFAEGVPAGIDYQESSVFTDDANASVRAGRDLTINFDFVDTNGRAVSSIAGGTTESVYVWFVRSGSNVAITSVTATQASNGTFVDNNAATDGIQPDANGVFEIRRAASGTDYDFQFSNSGTYTVRAAFNNPSTLYTSTGKTLSESFNDVEYKLATVSGQNSFEITASSTSSDYSMSLSAPSGVVLNSISGTALGGANGLGSNTSVNGTPTTAQALYYYTDDVEFGVSGIDANNVNTGNFTVKLVDNNGRAVRGQSVTLDTNSSNIELNKTSEKTDSLGQATFKVAASRDGEYKVYIKAGSYEATLTVKVGGVGAYNINVVKSPSAPIDITDDLSNKIQFTFTDANGNAVTAADASNNGAWAAFNSSQNLSSSALGVSDSRQYVAIVSQPSASDLENGDIKLIANTSNGGSNEYRADLYLDGADDLAEGSYTIRVVLDNGKYTNVTFEIKEFQTPVSLNLKYEADAVEIGSYVAIDTLEWVDANGVTKDADGRVDLAATGYAVENFYTEEAACYLTGSARHEDSTGTALRHSIGTVEVKDDDKYVGQTITVMAVDDRYNLTANATLAVADEATALAFNTKTLAVDANNKVSVSVVDGNGNTVAINRGKSATISYVVLDKPADAKVSVSTDGADNNLTTEGTFVMNVTANTVGNVTIQAVARVTQDNNVVKYYTGTQIFAVGKDSVGQVVVMSIGSSEVIVNDTKATMDAAPMIRNNRTFVPFRALAEAFGAEVAYDEATQAITAELNGVTVVMTIGSATYTVNGTENTMDVAPFINGSRTMVPVRFAAEAFGIKVIPTYDQNGGTADILFNL